jgi:hypothetical protein
VHIRPKGKSSVPEEVQGGATVMMNALAGPKGVVLEGQIGSLQVIRADVAY